MLLLYPSGARAGQAPTKLVTDSKLVCSVSCEARGPGRTLTVGYNSW